MALSLLSGLMVVTAGSAVAKPSGGNNSADAKLCKNWQSLYKEDGSGFADKGDCTSHAAEGGTILTSPPPPPALPYQVTILPPSPGSGNYEAAGATFGPTPTQAGVTGPLFLANDGNGTSQGCSTASFAGMPAGSIAIVDAGGCEFTFKALNAQANGAVAVIVLNNVPGDPVTMEGTAPSLGIPAVMVSQEDGFVIKATLIGGSGIVSAAP
ncbi:MAG TPA: PA domain-containing protein [Acidimicrobiia bacterium]|nr:PA domain-containing protein [Acidimicrobiia bacterium]